MPGYETHVDGLIPCARNGHGLETTPIPEARLQYPVRRLLRGRTRGLHHIKPEEARGWRTCRAPIARELQEKGEIPPGEIKGVKRVR